MTRSHHWATFAAAVTLHLGACAAQDHPVADDVADDPRWLTYAGGEGPGAGRHIVLVAADQEYRSEQSMPMLARILARHHGFHCTVLFAQNVDGLVDPTMPTRQDDKEKVHDIPGLNLLAKADLMILFSRFMSPSEQALGHIIDYIDAGKPIVALRTANHGFLGPFPYEIDGRKVRFGDDVLGGTFRGHHGGWHRESTRGILVEAQREHPILRGVDDVWGPSDVYRTYPQGKALPEGCTALVMGQPLTGLAPDDPPNAKKIALPVAWTKTWTGSKGKAGRVFHCTMGSARDFESAGLRRLVTNAAYWCMHLEGAIDGKASVDYVGKYEPLPSGFNYDNLGVKPRPVAFYR